MSNKVVVFGLDGASWNMLDSIFRVGLMPRLEKLAKKHGRGKLQSSIPPATLPAWMDFATGVSSGQHGAVGLVEPGKEIGVLEPFMGKKSSVKTFYEKLDAKGYKCILINFPASFPLNLNHGAGLASFVNSSKRDYYPESLLKEIPEIADYKTFPDYAASSVGLLDPFGEYFNLEKKRFAIAKKLFQKHDWDFFFYLISSYDWVFHKIGSERFERVLAKQQVRKLFKEMDKQIGWFTKKAKTTNFIIMSDHGEKEFGWVFYPNVWLQKQGYLKINETTYSSQEDVTFAIKQIGSSVRESGSRLSVVFNFFDRHPKLYSSLGKIIRRGHFLMPSILMEGRFSDWGLTVSKTSQAYFYGGFFIRTKLSKKGGRELVSKLKGLTLPNSERKLFSGVYLTGELYKGKHLGNFPQIVLESETCVCDPALWSKDVIKRKLSYNHQKEGIYIAFGPNLKTENEMPIRNISQQIMKTITA